MKKKFKIITLFPEMIHSYLSEALLSKAMVKGLISVEVTDLRLFSDNSYKSVDDRPYGGSDGLLIRADILESALKSLLDVTIKQKVIYLSPQGTVLRHQKVISMAEEEIDEYILICGRYAGIDSRFIDQYVDEEVSIGDYILSGGELPALVLIESISRFIPGVLGNKDSVICDTLENDLLEAPQYTKPRVWNGKEVPSVLLSGHHDNILNWKRAEALKNTLIKRPDLICYDQLSLEEKKMLEKFGKDET